MARPGSCLAQVCGLLQLMCVLDWCLPFGVIPGLQLYDLGTSNVIVQAFFIRAKNQ